MRLVPDRGLWSTGPVPPSPPLAAVLEVSGAVLSWPADDPAQPVHIAFTDVAQADWLWRLLGPAGHTALVAATTAGPREPVEVDGVEIAADAVAPLRRLALGHWLRRWWPASRIDGIAELDGALLDAEVAVLTADAEDFLDDDTFDADAAQLLRPHAAHLDAVARLGDPRIADLVARCAELAADLGVPGFAGASPAAATPAGHRRDDYALVAGASRGPEAAGVVASGSASIGWGSVPPGIFDAAEHTVRWTVRADGPAVAHVDADLLGGSSAAGITVRVANGPITGWGEFDAQGRASLALYGAAGEPLTESAAWDVRWQDTAVTVGVAAGESAQVRHRVRQFARSRLSAPGADAFLAEVLAAEADY
ncbi:hypothetical protein E4P42_21005 [Mycobacterium sp. PS03-16]|uniref:hypothetical protein n=1 Tax=Mycobacterium sp. PS03-16 TaxID=2559611 RepID=UPI001072F69D|nr:hypothetical protein [Mycobacterium sp. PS03-16]TFV55942.1 hypothetical protein E4P42_21005 [Mycobacterium sp. PS03-16]